MAGSLFVPLLGSAECLQIACDELPVDEREISRLLMENRATPTLWNAFAIAYLELEMFEQCERLLLKVCKFETIEFARDIETRKKMIFEASVSLLSLVHLYFRNDIFRNEKTFYAKSNELVESFFVVASELECYSRELIIARGLVAHQRNDVKMAHQQFLHAINDGDLSSGLLAVAASNYSIHRYKDALDCYVRVMTRYPNCPSYVRNMMGMCLIQLKKVPVARRCFEITLSKEPNNVLALVALATLDLKSDAKANEAVLALSRAVELEFGTSEINLGMPASPWLLYSIGCALNLQGKFEDAYRVLQKSIGFSSIGTDLKADCHHEMGKCLHLQRKYETAITNYNLAIELKKQKSEMFPLAQFAVSQCYLKKGQYDLALPILNSLSQSFPDCVDVLKLQSIIYSVRKHPDAKALLTKISVLDPEDIDNWVRLADFLAPSDRKESFAAYKKAMHNYKVQKKTIPLEVWNNVGVLAFMLEKFSEAQIAFTQCIGSSQLTAENITIFYNLARCYEANGTWNKARDIYSNINKNFPKYVDALVRIGVMDKNCGAFTQAVQSFKSVSRINPDHVESHVFHALLLQDTGNAESALSVLEHVAKKVTSSHATPSQKDNVNFVRLAIAACKLEMYSDSRNEHKKEFLYDAANHYNAVLKANPNNVYAAHGVAVLCAHKEKPTECQQVLTNVREFASALPDVWLNLAHSRVEMRQYVSASNLYSKCSKEFYGDQDPTVLMYLARSQYKNEQMLSCKRVLSKALFLTPHNDMLWYDLSLAEEDYGVMVLQKAKNQRVATSVQELKAVVAGFKNASIHFSRLSKIDAGPMHSYRSKSDLHAKYCEECLVIAKLHLETQLENEDKREAKRLALEQNKVVVENNKKSVMDVEKPKESSTPMVVDNSEPVTVDETTDNLFDEDKMTYDDSVPVNSGVLLDDEADDAAAVASLPSVPVKNIADEED